MVYILVRHQVKDFVKFRKEFLNNLKLVPKNGSQGGFIFRNKENRNEVFVLIKWDSLENFHKFSNHPNIPKDVREKATVIGTPEGFFFEDVEEF